MPCAPQGVKGLDDNNNDDDDFLLSKACNLKTCPSAKLTLHRTTDMEN